MPLKDNGQSLRWANGGSSPSTVPCAYDGEDSISRESAGLDIRSREDCPLNEDGSVAEQTNPFVRTGLRRPEIYTWGHRNESGLDF